MLSSLAKEHNQQQQIRKQQLGKNFKETKILTFLNLIYIILIDKKRVIAIESTNKFSQLLIEKLNKE
jgi:hypothetical protein